MAAAVATAAAAAASGTSGAGASAEPANASVPSSSRRSYGLVPTVERIESDADLVNPLHLQSLMDMGFPRDQCVEALLFTTSLEQATDYLLSTPPSILRAPQPTPAPSTAAAASGAAGTTGTAGAAGAAAMDTEVTDDDAVMRAIALSLAADAEPISSDKEPQEPVLNYEPLAKSVLDLFVQDALAGCLTLLDALPETVYRVCSLVVAMVQRNGQAYRDNMLASLADEIDNCVNLLQVRLVHTSF